MLLREYHTSDHWNQRKKERIDNVQDIVLPDDFYLPDEDRTEVNQKLLTAIKQAVNSRITSFIHGEDVEREKYNVTVLATIHLLRNKKTYTPGLKATSIDDSKESESSGNSYVAFSKEDRLITLLLLPENQITKEGLIRRAIYSAQKQKGEIVDSESISAHFRNDSLVRLSVDHILKAKETKPEGRITDPSQLPYKVRGDYRNSTPEQPSFFIHKDYGKGKIIASDKGMTSTGIWDSITVKFPDQPTPKVFKKLYTTTYFRTPSTTTVQEYIDLLQNLIGKQVNLL